MRYLHLADHYSARIRKADRTFEKELDFKDINFPVKIRKKRIVLSLVFLVMKIRKNIQSMCLETLSRNMLIYYC